MSGAWVKIYMYNQSDDQFSFDKNMLPNQLNPIPGLGNDAFSTKVGTDACVYIRKGNTTLLVSSSGGLNFAKQTAQKAFARLK
jgi:hypothetical protein